MKLVTRVVFATLILTGLLATLAPAASAAQDATATPDPARRTIAVEGTGTVDIAPDTAQVSFGVRTQNESLETAQDENSTRTQAIMDAFTAAGIADADVATSQYSVFVINEYDRDGNLVGVRAYEVFNQVTVIIRDLSIVGEVLDSAVGAGANEVGAISFYVDNTDEASSQARAAAVENARAKADELAEASGVVVVGVYTIAEISAPQPDPIQFGLGGAAPMAAEDSAVREVPVSPGQTQVTVRVQVEFEIEQPQG